MVNSRSYMFNCLTYVSRSHGKSFDGKVSARGWNVSRRQRSGERAGLQDYEFLFTMQELRVTSPSDGPVRKLSRQRSQAGNTARGWSFVNYLRPHTGHSYERRALIETSNELPFNYILQHFYYYIRHSWFLIACPGSSGCDVFESSNVMKEKYFAH